MPNDVDALLLDQSGVISRRQAVARGMAKHDLARMVRRRDWAPVFDGVYVNHTGELSWLQLAWAAVLFSWPAALSHESAMRAARGPGRREDDQLMQVAVDRHRHLTAPDGVVVHRMTNFADKVLWNLGPPRMRLEEAAIDVAAGKQSEFAALGVLAEICQSRRTTASRLATAVAHRQRIARRDWMVAVLRDVASGTCSVLEHGYLTRVERPHGLPHSSRQLRSTSSTGAVYRDVEYAGGLIVELDGRLFHDTTAQRDRDFERDLDAAVDGRQTVRVSWGQVFDRPCSTARRIGVLLNRRGWKDTVRACPDCGPER